MISVNLRIKNTELTITSVAELIKFQESESKAQIEGSITYDGTKHFAYSLSEALLVISSLNIGDLSKLVSLEVDLENSSEEIQEIILDAVVEIESLESKSEVNISKHEHHNNFINNSVYGITISKSSLMILNVDMHDRFLFNNEMEYEDKCVRHITLTNNQIAGVKSHFRDEVLAKYGTYISEESCCVDLKNCHENIRHIAIGLVRELDNVDAKTEININQNDHSVLESNGNNYSIYIVNNTLFAHKEFKSCDELLNEKGIAKITLSAELISKCIAEDFEDEIDPYIVNLENVVSIAKLKDKSMGVNLIATRNDKKIHINSLKKYYEF